MKRDEKQVIKIQFLLMMEEYMNNQRYTLGLLADTHCVYESIDICGKR